MSSPPAEATASRRPRTRPRASRAAASRSGVSLAPHRAMAARPDLAAEVWAALAGVADPCSLATGVPVNIVDMGIVDDVRVEGAAVSVRFVLTSPVCMQAGNIFDQVERTVTRIAGVDSVICEVDRSDVWGWTPDRMAPEAIARLRAIRDHRRIAPAAGRDANHPNYG